MRAVTTIGVYGHTLEEFVDALRAADVAMVLDVRQRRGVRGPEYAWANAQRLQRALASVGVDYRHRKELAPTTELRELQYAADTREGVGKRGRRRLDAEYRRRYTAEILDRVDLCGIVDAMPTAGATALLCVEADDAACHRSIVAARLATCSGVEALPPAADAPTRPAHAPAPPNADPWPPGHVPTAFEQAVVDAVVRTSPGDLVGYGELAIELGRPGAGQAVANVLRRAPDVPWWRVLPADGRLYRSHVATQRPLLEAEGHTFDDRRRVRADATDSVVCASTRRLQSRAEQAHPEVIRDPPAS